MTICGPVTCVVDDVLGRLHASISWEGQIR